MSGWGSRRWPVPAHGFFLLKYVLPSTPAPSEGWGGTGGASVPPLLPLVALLVASVVGGWCGTETQRLVGVFLPPVCMGRKRLFSLSLCCYRGGWIPNRAPESPEGTAGCLSLLRSGV